MDDARDLHKIRTHIRLVLFATDINKVDILYIILLYCTIRCRKIFYYTILNCVLNKSLYTSYIK